MEHKFFYEQVSSDIYLYRYTRLKLGWDTLGYSLFSSLTAFYAALGIIIMLPVLMRCACFHHLVQL